MKEEQIINCVCERMGITEKGIKGSSRRFKTVLARHIAMYLISIKEINSLKEIGEIFGGRDHSTVIYALRRVENEIAYDDRFKALLQELYLLVVGKEFVEFQKVRIYGKYSNNYKKAS